METAQDRRDIRKFVSDLGLRERLGVRLRSARTNSGLLQQALAEKLGVSRASIASIEAGKQSISVEQLVKIANLLEVSPVDILAEVLDLSLPATKDFDRLPDAHRTFILQVKGGVSR